MTQFSVDKSTFRSLKDRYFVYGHCGVEKSLNLQVDVTNFNTESNICHARTMGVWSYLNGKNRWSNTLKLLTSPPKTLKATWTSIQQHSSSVFGCSTYSECRMELRHVQRSSGSMAHNVIMLLNFASRMLRCSPAACVWLAKVSSKEDSLIRLVKYCTQSTVKFMSLNHVSVQLVYLKSSTLEAHSEDKTI